MWYYNYKMRYLKEGKEKYIEGVVASSSYIEATETLFDVYEETCVCSLFLTVIDESEGVLELVNEVVSSDSSNNSEFYKLHNNAMEYSNLS